MVLCFNGSLFIHLFILLCKSGCFSSLLCARCCPYRVIPFKPCKQPSEIGTIKIHVLQDETTSADIKLTRTYS